LFGTRFMFMAGWIAFVAFARFGLGAVNATAGAAVAIFVGATAVAELAVGLAMAALIYREHRSLAVDADRGYGRQIVTLILLSAASRGPLVTWCPTLQ